MNNFFEQFKNEARKTVLTRAEKSAMKARILGAPSAVAAHSPYFFFNFQFKHALVPALAVLVVLFGTGTAYAAEGSLPGDPLYAVKLNVTEPLQTALAVTAEGRAEVHIALAQKRVEEAEALAGEGKLTASTSQELQDNFEAHTEAADALALEVGHNDPAAAVELQARADSSLSVHGAILATLAGESSDSGTRSSGGRLASRVLARVQAGKASSARATAGRPSVATAATEGQSGGDSTHVQTFASAAPTATATATVQAQDTSDGGHGSDNDNEQRGLAARAGDALQGARKQYADIKDKLASTTVAQLDAQFAQVDASLAAGDAQGALSLALKLQAILGAQEHYHGNIITPLLNLDIGTHSGGGGQD